VKGLDRVRIPAIGAPAAEAPAKPDELDLLHLYVQMKQEHKTVCRLMRDIETGVGSRSVTVSMLERATRRLATLCQTLAGAALPDPRPEVLDAIIEPEANK
jgi:hypothetical protein